METVSIERCDSYNEEEVYNAVERLVDHLGGWKAFIKPGKKVAVKPNLLMVKKPEDAATTHPSVVKAVVSQIQKAGGIVTIAESPGGPYNLTMLKYVYKITGIEKVADETGAILNFDLRVESRERNDNKYIRQLEVIKPLADADIIINLPKLKTHTMMVYTGAVKNMFGSIAGTAKTDYHLRMPDYNKFADSIIDIYLSSKPTLNLMDGIIGMEGYGPSSGNPRHIGILLASADGFALDAIAVKAIQLPCNKVPILCKAKERGLLVEDIRITGETIENVLVSDFNVPALNQTEQFNERKLFSQAKRFLRPRPIIQRNLCVQCGNCARNCPPKVISIEKGKVPLIDYNNCIRCFCCHELCGYKAIIIHRSMLSKIIMNRKMAGDGRQP